MPSLVSNFIIEPVLRQARRLSSNFATSESAPDQRIFRAAQSRHEGAIEEPADEAGISDDSEIHDFDSLRSLSMPIAAPTSSTMARNSRFSSLHLSTSPEIRDGLSSEASMSTSAPPARPATAIATMRSVTIGGDILPDRDRLGLPDDGAQVMSTSLPRSLYGMSELPEDDGMKALRQRILQVQSQQLAPEDKARMMHGLLMEGYNKSQAAINSQLPPRSATPSSPTTVHERATPTRPLESLRFWHSALGEGSTTQKFVLTEDDVRPTYVPLSGKSVDYLGNSLDLDEGTNLLGCEHYRRNVKLQCFTCSRWYTCRLCHNEAEDHALPRRETRNMLCMLCGHAQKASDVCVKCGESAACYYCSICKLWNDDPGKSIYHCNDCGICRVGEGLGKDFFHCKKCGSCIAIALETSHRCREGLMDCDCPICGEYLFTSHKMVLSMKCGHMIHNDCHKQYIQTAYKCPICSKSVQNMESQFRRLDKHLEEQPMPSEWQQTRAVILCNDCEAKTTTKYHWGGLKCEVCLSYNTVQLQLVNAPKGAAESTEENPSGDTSLQAANAPSGEPEAERAVSNEQPLPHHQTSHRPGGSLGSRVDFQGLPPGISPERFARSLSPTATSSFPEHMLTTDESDGEGSILDFWGRDEHRSMTSAENVDHEDSDEETDSDECEDDPDEDEDEDEEEEIMLFGHR